MITFTDRRAFGAAAVLLAVLAVLLAVTACGSAKKEPTMDLTTMKQQTLSEMHEIVTATGMSFDYLVYGPQASDSSGLNPFQAAVVGTFAPSTPAASSASVASWVQDLEAHGWTSDTGAVSHRSTFVDKGPLRIILTPQLVATGTPNAAPINLKGGFELLGVVADLKGIHDVGELAAPQDILSMFAAADPSSSSGPISTAS